MQIGAILCVPVLSHSSTNRGLRRSSASPAGTRDPDARPIWSDPSGHASTPVDLYDIEEALTAARIVAALLVATVLVTASTVRSAGVAALVYLAFALAVHGAVRSGAIVSTPSRIVLHVFDVLVPIGIGWMVPPARDVTSALSLVPLAAAAVRWGGAATLATLAVTLVAAVLRGRSGVVAATPYPAVAALLVGGTLAAFFGMLESRRRFMAASIARLRDACASSTGFKATLATAGKGLGRLFGADVMSVTTTDARSGRAVEWIVRLGGGGESRIERRDVSASPDAGADCGPDQERRLRATFAAGSWSGCVAISTTSGRATGPQASAALAAATRELTPVLHAAYVCSETRASAGRHERARLARALHDGTIQSLIGAEMQIAAAARAAEHQRPDPGVLQAAQAVLREEIAGLRELMARMRPVDLLPEDLPEHLAGVVERFAHDTDTATTFTSDPLPRDLDGARCLELVRIVREALANARKHSGATRVSVSLTSGTDGLTLIVQDNGRGFPFDGRLPITDGVRLPGTPVPEAIRESVRLLGGEFTIQSKPGRGALLEIRAPWKAAGSAERDRVAS